MTGQPSTSFICRWRADGSANGSLSCVPSQLNPRGSGWSSTAFLVSWAWVYRFPRRQIAVPCVKTESAALPQVATQLELPIPHSTWIGRPASDYRWPSSSRLPDGGRRAARTANRVRKTKGTRRRQDAAGVLARSHNAFKICDLRPEMRGQILPRRTILAGHLGLARLWSHHERLCYMLARPTPHSQAVAKIRSFPLPA